MKSNNIILFIYLILVTHFVSAQNDLSMFLQSVEQNNLQLKSARNYMEAQILESGTGITPQNPTIEYGNMPGNSSESGVKKVYGISQELDFPTTYFVKINHGKQKKLLSQLAYESVKWDVLQEANSLYYQYVFSLKMVDEYKQRMSNAEKLYSSFYAKMDQGNASILEVNKAKILFLSSKIKYETVLQEKEDIEIQLQLINGGQAFTRSNPEYSYIHLPSLEKVREMYLNRYPSVKYAEQEVVLSNINTKVEKQKNLPNIMIGYEVEEEPGGTYSGLKTGITIPLWQNKNGTKTAKALTTFHQTELDYQKARIALNIEKEYNRALRYKGIMSDFDENLLSEQEMAFIEKALNLGQISIIEYINELAMYYDIIDLKMETEKNYYITLGKILGWNSSDLE